MGTRSLLAAWNAGPPVALIVDRDADTRKLYAEYLKLSACVVEEAEDGREALAKAISHQPDVIITETRLPGMSGYELCELLRSDASTRNIPIVIVTADAFQIATPQTHSADAVLVKPCLPESVLAEIYRLLDRSAELNIESQWIHDKMSKHLSDSHEMMPDSGHGFRRTILSRTYRRIETTEPAVAPPSLVCPDCDQALRYQRSHVGGVSARHPEQWDYFECANGCGRFQYRRRTRKLRKVSN
jgi:two-component system, cell cycle response regulator DivK